MITQIDWCILIISLCICCPFALSIWSQNKYKIVLLAVNMISFEFIFGRTV